MKGTQIAPLAVVVTLLASPVAIAQNAQSQSSDQKASSSEQKQQRKVDSGTQKFINEAAIGGMAEVELADMAQQKAQSPQVKEYAAHIKEHHQQANEKLKTIASSKGVQLPKELDNEQKKNRDKLAKMQGAEFDREYVNLMVKEHKDDVNKFEKQAKDAKDADLKNFAAQTAPQLRQHLQQAEQLQSSLKDAGGKGQREGASNAKDKKSSS